VGESRPECRRDRGAFTRPGRGDEGGVPLNSPSLPILIPPIYGLKGVGFETYTADGPISYWNSYVGVGQMGGHGTSSNI
jgi:hypothetical protein